MNRRKAREALFEMIFAMSFQPGEDAETQYALFLDDLELEEDGYIHASFLGIHDHVDELDAKISAHAVGWKTERLSHASLSIMRIAVYEMFYVEDVPPAAAINEAIEAAKKFDHENAPAFINGILNAIAKDEGLLL